jgi:transposase
MTPMHKSDMPQHTILAHSSRSYRAHTLLCRGSGLPLLFLLSPANVHAAPFARPLLAWAVALYQLHPRIIGLDAGYWGLRLIAWIHTVLGAVAVIPWNPKRQRNRSCLPPTWTAEEVGKRTAIERFFGRVFLFFRLQRPPLCGWSAVATRVAVTSAASSVVALAAQQAGVLISSVHRNGCWRTCGNLMFGIRNAIRYARETGLWYPTT